MPTHSPRDMQVDDAVADADMFAEILGDLPQEELSDIMQEPEPIFDNDRTTSDRTTCWGGLLAGTIEKCSPGFSPNKGHFKNHFCPACLGNGLRIPVSRVRAITAVQHASFENGGGRGLWSKSAALEDAGYNIPYRLINHTNKCIGPRLVILQTAAPSGYAWAPMPPRWLQNDREMLLTLCKGTLTPVEYTAADLWSAAPPTPLAEGADRLAAQCGSTTSAHTSAHSAVELTSVGAFASSASSDGSQPGDALMPLAAGSAAKRSRSSPASEEGVSSTVGSSSSANQLGTLPDSEVLTLIHEQLAKLIIHNFERPLEEQEVAGITDEQRTAFVALLPPLTVSAELLRRTKNRARPEHGSAAQSPVPPAFMMEGPSRADAASAEEVEVAGVPPDVEELARLHSKTFGVLDEVQSRHELCCRMQGLGDADLVTIARCCSSTIGLLRKLDLSENYLTSASAQTLATVLEPSISLEILDLSSSPWSDAGILCLSSALRRSGIRQLRRLGLRRCRMGDVGAEALALLLSETKAPALEDLGLEVNQISNGGLSSVAGALLLPAVAPRLRALCLGNLRGGNEIGDRGVIALAQAVKGMGFTALEKLWLAYNQIGDTGSAALAAALNNAANAPRLSLLSLSANRLSDKAVHEQVQLARARAFCLLIHPQLQGERAHSSTAASRGDLRV